MRIITLLFCFLTFFLRGEVIYDFGYASQHAEEIDSLDLSGNNKVQYYDFSAFQELVYLNLSGCQLTELPKGVSKLSSLKTLILNDNVLNDIQNVFDQVTNLTDLEVLKLTNGYLFYLPNSLGKLTNLKDLDVSGNYIGKLPDQIMHLRQLERLSISKNNLDTLPLSFNGLKSLKHLDVSFNESLWKERLLMLVKYAPGIEELSIRGWDTLPKHLGDLRNIKKLDVSDGDFRRIPRSISEMTSLKSLKVKSSVLFWDDMIEALSDCKSLRELEIGGCGLDNIPYNLFKLKSLKSLIISESNIKRVPSSIKRLGIQELSIQNSFIHSPVSVGRILFSTKRLKKITVNGCVFDAGSLRISSQGSLKRISFKSTSLDQIDKFIVGTELSMNVDLEECVFDPSKLQEWKRENSNLRFNVISKGTHELVKPLQLKKLNKDNHAQTHTVYGEVGLIIETEKGALIDIPENAFLNGNGEVVHGEVEVKVKFIKNKSDLLVNGLPYQVLVDSATYQGIVPWSVISVSAFKEGEQLKMNNENPVQFQLYNKKQDLNIYEYDKDLKLALLNNTLNTDTLSCYISQNNKLEKEILGLWEQDVPKEKTRIRKSKVQLKLKKGRRKKKFSFYLEPEYGFNEKYLSLLGTKVKAYPELKVYKEVQWNYAGKSEEEDFEKLYGISDGKPERMKRKSSFYLYVMSLNDVKIEPSKNGDYYDMIFYRGFDTLSIPVIPQVSVVKPRKIQKWHKRRYLKYLEAFKERNEKWKDLDSLKMILDLAHQNELNEYRKGIIQELSSLDKDDQSNYSSFTISSSKELLVGDVFRLAIKKEPLQMVYVDERSVGDKQLIYYYPERDLVLQSHEDLLSVGSNDYMILQVISGTKLAVGTVNDIINDKVYLKSINKEDWDAWIKNYLDSIN